MSKTAKDKSKEKQPLQLAVPQKHYGPKSLLASISIINITIAFAIDMFAPALPSMMEEFGASEAYLNVCVWVFLLVTAISILIGGPLTDRKGRKWVMLVGAILFTVGSLACMVSPSVGIMIPSRIIQAVGYGFLQVTITAITSDAYSGSSLKFAMTICQSVTLIGPAIAPFLGSFLIMVAGWREIFLLLTAIGVMSILLICPITETMQNARSNEKIGATLKSTGHKARGLLGSKAFLGMMLAMGFAAIPLSAFVSVSSYIFIDFFGTSYFEYSAAYAVVFAVSVISPYIYIALSRKLRVGPIVAITIVLLIVTGVSVLLVGTINPVVFTILFIPCVVAEGVIRPMAFVELLNQPEELAGTASSTVNFSYWIFFAIATAASTLPWPNFVIGLAILSIAGAAITAACEALRRKGIEEAREA